MPSRKKSQLSFSKSKRKIDHLIYESLSPDDRRRRLERNKNQNVRNLSSPERDKRMKNDRRRQSVRRRGIRKIMNSQKIRLLINDALNNNCKVQLQRLTKNDFSEGQKNDFSEGPTLTKPYKFLNNH